ncbi:PTS sugar transporter subunit IIA [Candidatus Sumerlaeota bacterium]|nr:PTS sugar transporter subunit IIA [Candidatus Sumerlaeota bacterium]
MRLKVRDAARLLEVSDKTIYRWVSQGRLPAYKINEQIRFNQAELQEWAAAQKINVNAGVLEQDKEAGKAPIGLAQALNQGGIYYRIEGRDPKSVLTSMVKVVSIPEEVDRDFLLQMLLARESLASTGIGSGISIPHPRNPIITHRDHAIVSLCFLEKPVDFNALDGAPVHTLFLMLSPTLQLHLRLISRVAHAVHDPRFMKLMREQATREKILRLAAEIDASIEEAVRE